MEVIAPKTRLIGISGKMGSGKNTCASLLSHILRLHHPGIKVEEVSFADKLKKLLIRITDCDPEAPYTVEGKQQPSSLVDKTVGNALQIIGTACREELGPNVWVDALFNKWKQSDIGTIYIVTDVRFLNEAQAIKQEGGVILRVERTVPNQVAESRDTKHISETELDHYPNFDYYVRNDKDLIDLTMQLIPFYHLLSL